MATSVALSLTLMPSLDLRKTENIWVRLRNLRNRIVDLENADVVPFHGAMISLGADLNLAQHTASTRVLPWPSTCVVAYDTHGYWSSSNPTQLVIPAGVSKVRLGLRVACMAQAQTYDPVTGAITSGSALPSTAYFSNRMRKNGNNIFFPGNVYQRNQESYPAISLLSGSIDVVAGDYFECIANTSLAMKMAPYTWCSWDIQKLE